MANTLYDNSYLILDTSTTALPWPTGGARVKTLTLYITGSNASAIFLLSANTPIFRFNLLTVGSATNTSIPSTYNFDFAGVRFQTAWIPSVLAACTAWIHFA